MSTTFLRSAILCVVLSACARTPQTLYGPMPAPPDSALMNDAAERSWQTVRVSDGYGSFEMRLPVLRVTRTQGSPALLIDSIALGQLEKRMIARVAKVARAEAAALHRTPTATPPAGRRAAATIQPGLLGTLTFGADSARPSAENLQRIAAVAQLARELPGTLEVKATIQGVGAAALDAALVRARQVYLALLAEQPSLADRQVRFTIEAQAGDPQTERGLTTVSVFMAAHR